VVEVEEGKKIQGEKGKEEKKGGGTII